MELPHVGQQCEQLNCKKLDFLPYICKCGRKFCSDHYTKHSESCSIITETHKLANLDKQSTQWKCSHSGCLETSLLPLICSKCHQHYCIQHRHVTECFTINETQKQAAIDKVRAPIHQFQEAKAKLDQDLNISLQNAAKKSRNHEIAIKVQLMRIKNKATGLKSIPITDRVYFLITKPEKYGKVQEPVFVSKSWSIGRAIDAIAENCNVMNQNNVSNAEKLRLFKQDKDEQLIELSEDLSLSLNALLNANLLQNGSNLYLEYVSN